MSDVGVETSTKIITNLRNKIKKKKDRRRASCKASSKR